MLAVHNITTPSSDEWYRKETISREPLAGIGSIFSMLNDAERKTLPESKDRELKRPLEEYNKAKNSLDDLLKNILQGTDFTNISSTLRAMEDLSSGLSSFIETAQKITHKQTESKTKFKSKGVAEVSQPKKKELEAILKIHTTLLELLKCCEFVIKINFDSETDLKYTDIRDEIIEAARSFSKSFKDLPIPNIESIQKDLGQLFASIGIEEFLNKGKVPEFLKNTMFELPSEMTVIALDLIKKLTDQVDKDQVLNCYKEILLKNNSIKELTILACKEIIKLQGYELVLEILNLINIAEEPQEVGINNDIFVLKLFCQVGIQDLESAYRTLQNISKELLVAQDKELLFAIRQILQDKVEALYESEMFGEIRNIANEYKEIFDIECADDPNTEYREFFDKVSSNQEISEALKVIFPEYKHQLASDSLEEVYIHTDIPKKLQANIVAHNIEMMVGPSKYLDVSFSKDDLDKFWKNKQGFINEYTRSQPTISEDSIYGLLLNTAIVCNNKEVIQYVLEISHSENILTHIDKLNFSPISRALYSGNEEILQLVKNYIEQEKSIVKVALAENDFNNIITILEFSQFEDLTVEKCIEEYLKPLYINESINRIEGILLGEDANEALYENLSFSSVDDEDFIFDESDEYCSSIWVSGDCTHI